MEGQSAGNNGLEAVRNLEAMRKRGGTEDFNYDDGGESVLSVKRVWAEGGETYKLLTLFDGVWTEGVVDEEDFRKYAVPVSGEEI